MQISKSRREGSFSRTQALANQRKSSVLIDRPKKKDDYLLIVNEYNSKPTFAGVHPLFESQKRLRVDQKSYAPANSPTNVRLDSPQPHKFLSKRLSQLPPLRQSSRSPSIELVQRRDTTASSNFLQSGEKQLGSTQRKPFQIKALKQSQQFIKNAMASAARKKGIRNSSIGKTQINMNRVHLPAPCFSIEAADITRMLSSGSNNSTCHDTVGRLSALLHPSDMNQTMHHASNMSDSSIRCMSSNMPGTAINEVECYLFGSSLPAVSSTHSEEEAGSSAGPREIMHQRWQQVVESMLPHHDLVDLAAEQIKRSLDDKRQFAPEFSDTSYQAMLEKEYAIGDYLCLKDSEQRLTSDTRRHMVTLVEALIAEKEYKEETLFLAVSLCDRYLVNLAIGKKTPPCLIMLAIVGTLMAAKLEQPIQPNFNRMIRLVKQKWDVDYLRNDLIKLETHIIHTLDFDLHYNSPLIFLERYLRLYELDRVKQDPMAYIIDKVARVFCRCILRSKAHLSLKPSQIAAAALSLAANVSKSPLVERLGTKQLNAAKLDQLIFDDVVCTEFNSVRQSVAVASVPKLMNCPLRMWSSKILDHARLDLDFDIKPSYLMLLKEADRVIFAGQLAQDRSYQPSTARESSLQSAVRLSV